MSKMNETWPSINERCHIKYCKICGREFEIHESIWSNEYIGNISSQVPALILILYLFYNLNCHIPSG